MGIPMPFGTPLIPGTTLIPDPGAHGACMLWYCLGACTLFQWPRSKGVAAVAAGGADFTADLGAASADLGRQGRISGPGAKALQQGRRIDSRPRSRSRHSTSADKGASVAPERKRCSSSGRSKGVGRVQGGMRARQPGMYEVEVTTPPPRSLGIQAVWGSRGSGLSPPPSPTQWTRFIGKWWATRHPQEEFAGGR